MSERGVRRDKKLLIVGAVARGVARHAGEGDLWLRGWVKGRCREWMSWVTEVTLFDQRFWYR